MAWFISNLYAEGLTNGLDQDQMFDVCLKIMSRQISKHFETETMETGDVLSICKQKLSDVQ